MSGTSRRSRAVRPVDAQTKYDLLTAIAPHGTLELDAKGVILSATARTGVILGLPATDLSGKSLPVFVSGDSAALAAQISGSGGPPCDHRFRRPDGTETLCQVVILPIMQDGLRAGSIATLMDVTERRAALADRQATEERFRAVADSSPLSIVMTDLQGTILYASPQTLALHGYERENELIGKNSAELIAPEERAGIQAAMEPAFLLGIVRDRKFTLIRRDGSRFMGDLSASIMRGRDGRPLGFVTTARDITELHRTGEALRAAEGRYKTLVEAAPLAVTMTDLKGNIIYASPRALALHGAATEADVVGRPAFDLIAPEERPRALANMQITLRDGMLQGVEYALLRKDGTRFQGELNNAVIMGQDGRPQAFMAITRDVTEERRSRTALRESEEKYRTLVANALAIIARIDTEGRFLLVNRMFLELTGLPEAEVIGQNADLLARYMDGDQFAVMVTAVHRVLAARVKTEAEFAARRPDGRAVVLHQTAYPWFTVTGDFGGAEIITYDVTEARAVAELLRASEERYRKLFEHAHDGIVICDREGRIVDVNRRLLEITGHNREATIGRGVDGFSTPVEADRIRAALGRVLQGATAHLEVSLRREDGSDAVVDVSTSLIDPEQGLVQAIIRDITAQKAAEREHRQLEGRLRRAEKMAALGTLAGGVVHDLNNVMWGLVSYPDLILANLPQDSPLRGAILTIQQSGQKAAALVQDLLTLARRGLTVNEAVNLNGIVNEFMESPELEALLAEHPQVRVATDLEPELKNLVGSGSHLAKTVMNLALNAAEAMPEGGCITVTTRTVVLDSPRKGYETVPAGRFVALEVADEGVGIEAADLEKVFEPFYTKKIMKRSGTGLGLAVVWGTVKDHSGFIDLQSRPGEGTVFRLYFPLTETDTHPRVPVSPDTFRGHGERVLAVDDLADQRQIATMMLGRLGYRVESVSSGEEAVAHLAAHKTDLVLLDLIMDPGIDGLETYRRIIRLRPGQKVIIASGYADPDLIKQAEELGVSVFLRKPYTLESLGLAVADTLKA